MLRCFAVRVCIFVDGSFCDVYQLALFVPGEDLVATGLVIHIIATSPDHMLGSVVEDQCVRM